MYKKDKLKRTWSNYNIVNQENHIADIFTKSLKIDVFIN